MQLSGMWREILKVAPQGEVQPSGLRTAVLSHLSENSYLNTGSYSGQAGARLRVERLTCILKDEKRRQLAGGSWEADSRGV